MKKRDTSGLKIECKRELHDHYANEETYKNAYATTTFLFSVTGDDTVERTNYLYEKEWLKDVPVSVSKWNPQDIWEPAHKKGDCEYSRSSSVSQKILCVGGPLAGKRVTGAKDYFAFNAADFTSRMSPSKNRCRVIFVHKSCLEEK
jgi:hypothetical protein